MISNIKNLILSNKDEIFITIVVSLLGYIGTIIIKNLSVILLRKPIQFKEVFASVVPSENLEIATELISEVDYDSEDENIYYKGSMLKAIIENRDERDFSIAQTWIVIDEVKSFEIRDLEVIGHKVGEYFSIFVINNGYADIDNIKLSLKGNCDSETGKDELSDEDLGKILCCGLDKIYFLIQHLKSGEIRRIADYRVNIQKLKSRTRGRNWLYICKDVYYDKMIKNNKEFLASLVWYDNRLDVVYCEGGTPDVEKFQVEIRCEEEFPERKELPSEFTIGAKGSKQLQVATYVNRSSLIQYHFELRFAKKKRIVSKKNIVKIAVPIYETDNGFYEQLRNWIVENNIIQYQLNDKVALQRTIKYKMSKEKQ